MVARDTDFPPVWMIGFALTGAMLGKVFPLHLPYQEVVGGLLCAVALMVMILACLQLVLARTTLIPGRDPRRLQTSGVYRFSRNPIYLADAILLTGLFIGWGAYVALPLVFLFMHMISKRFISDEEARLARIFGDAFFAYRTETRRWI